MIPVTDTRVVGKRLSASADYRLECLCMEAMIAMRHPFSMDSESLCI